MKLLSFFFVHLFIFLAINAVNIFVFHFFSTFSSSHTLLFTINSVSTEWMKTEKFSAIHSFIIGLNLVFFIPSICFSFLSFHFVLLYTTDLNFSLNSITQFIHKIYDDDGDYEFFFLQVTTIIII